MYLPNDILYLILKFRKKIMYFRKNKRIIKILQGGLLKFPESVYGNNIVHNIYFIYLKKNRNLEIQHNFSNQGHSFTIRKIYPFLFFNTLRYIKICHNYENDILVRINWFIVSSVYGCVPLEQFSVYDSFREEFTLGYDLLENHT
jgi:hypothetical protein